MASRREIFVSSVVRGFEANRDAAVGGITAAGHRARRSEDFGALDQSPREACIQGVRDCDATVLLLGRRYGDRQQSGLSATHEEFREAMRLQKPVFVFIEQHMEPEEEQTAFVREVRDYRSGRVTLGFNAPADLTVAVTRALLRWEQGLEVARADPEELIARARSRLGKSMSGESSLILVVAGGPQAQVVRPAELIDPQLARQLMQMAMFGDSPVLVAGDQTATTVDNGGLDLRQRNRSVTVDENGTLRVVAPALTASVGLSGAYLSTAIQEDVEASILGALRFALAAMDRLDASQRLTDVAVVAAIDGTGHVPWRTRAEQAASPNSYSMKPNQPQTAIATLPERSKARAAIQIELGAIASDLTTILARQLR